MPPLGLVLIVIAPNYLGESLGGGFSQAVSGKIHMLGAVAFFVVVWAAPNNVMPPGIVSLFLF